MRGQRLHMVLSGLVFALVLGACVGLVDRDGGGLDTPPGGWDRHAPG